MAATILLDTIHFHIRCPEKYASTDAELEAVEAQVETAVDTAEDVLRTLLEGISNELKLEVER